MAYSFRSSVTLEHFLSPSSILASLFKPQNIYPSFFETNLLDPQRVIFKFIDTPTNNAVRVFYFQLFRLCFDVKVNELIEPRDYLTELKTVILDDRFRIKCNQKQSIDTQRLNNSMFKPLLVQFFQLLERENKQKFEDIIVKYPILDNIFLNVFKTFLSDFQVLKDFDSQLTTKVVIEQLAKIFDLSITKINSCYRFDEADVFCYIHTDKQLYIASKNKQNRTYKTDIKLPVSALQEDKQNYPYNYNLTPGKPEYKNHQVSTGVIEEQSSYLSESSLNQSVFSKHSIEKFNQSSSGHFQTPIQQFSNGSKSVVDSLNNILQCPAYEPDANYEDFTSTLVLQIIHQPHRQTIRGIKDRAKQRRGIVSGIM